jgi:hypothetical protein
MTVHPRSMRTSCASEALDALDRLPIDIVVAGIAE